MTTPSTEPTAAAAATAATGPGDGLVAAAIAVRHNGSGRREGTAAATTENRRPRPGERRLQILRALAEMLEQPGAERITTAALAARLSVSEAALYRHFASKAQMFDALIEFIETSVFALIDQVIARETDGALQACRVAMLLLEFGESHPGMVRVMVGDALVFEHERLGQRVNRLFDRVETQLCQCLQAAATTGPEMTAQDARMLASDLTALIIGRLQRFSRSGFSRCPTGQLEPLLLRLATRPEIRLSPAR